MHRWSPLPFEKVSLSARWHTLLVVLTATLALPTAVVASALPFPLILPAFGIMLLALAGIISAVAWYCSADRHSENISLWDVAGIFALVGFAAVLLSKPEEVLPLFEHPIANP